MSDDIQEVVENAAEYVSVQADEVAEFARRLSAAKLRFGFFGVALGAVTGSAVTYFVAKRQIEAKANQRADEEIAEMRDHYVAKGVALEVEKGKGDLASLVREKGYTTPEPETSVSPPMAVQPPDGIKGGDEPEPSEEEMGEDEVEGPRGVKQHGEDEVRNIFRERQREREAYVPFEWDPHAERKQRRPDRPYVIHEDEQHDVQGYSEVSLTYYALDDVICDETDEIMDTARRDEVIGEANLDRFGHGTGDPSIVFVRNDNLEITYEIIRSPNSYAQEVHGLDPMPQGEIRHDSGSGYNVERMRRRELDEER